MNEHRGEVTLTLGGTDYVLRPTFDAVEKIERTTGLGLVSLVMRFARMEFSLSDIKAVLSHSIKAAGQKVPDNIGDMIMDAGPRNLAPICTDYLSRAMAGGETKNAEAPAEVQ